MYSPFLNYESYVSMWFYKTIALSVKHFPPYFDLLIKQYDPTYFSNDEEKGH
tara:strand:- start:23199 stop:23354 length:156 start_codon:yes stop_codon:yes gene_type:complete